MISVQPVMWKSRPPIHRIWLPQQPCVNPLQQKIWSRPSFPDSNLRNDFLLFQASTENLDFNQLRHLAEKLNQKGKFLWFERNIRPLCFIRIMTSSYLLIYEWLLNLQEFLLNITVRIIKKLVTFIAEYFTYMFCFGFVFTKQ